MHLFYRNTLPQPQQWLLVYEAPPFATKYVFRAHFSIQGTRVKAPRAMFVHRARGRVSSVWLELDALVCVIPGITARRDLPQVVARRARSVPT